MIEVIGLVSIFLTLIFFANCFRDKINFQKLLHFEPHGNKKLEILLERSGVSKSEARFFVVRCYLFAGVGFVFGILGLFFHLPFYLPPLFAACGYFFPRMRLQNKIRDRQSQIIFGLPYYLDIVTLALEAGLDLVAAIEELIERDSPNPLQEEFYITLKSIRMGATRSEAFRQLADRTGVEPLSHLSTCISQSEELGASLGHLFRLQSESLRQEIFRIAEEKAQKAPIKMLLPLIGLIFPVVFLLLFGPIALRIMGGL